MAITAESQDFKKCLSQEDLISNSVDRDVANAFQCIIMYYANVPSPFYQYVSFSVQCIQPPTEMTSIRLRQTIDLQQPLSICFQIYNFLPFEHPPDSTQLNTMYSH